MEEEKFLTEFFEEHKSEIAELGEIIKIIDTIKSTEKETKIYTTVFGIE